VVPAGPAFPPPPGVKFPAPAGVKFPAAPSGPKPLVLPRRVSPLQRAQEAQQATKEARRSIGALMSQSRPPWGGGTPSLSGRQVEELEKTIRTLEAKLSEREMALAAAESKLTERERELAEAEALLEARAQVVEAAQKQPSGEGSYSKEQEAALKKLKEELDRQEQSLEEQRQALQERQDFLEQSETALFEKMQAQQEKETELEQKEEDLKRLARQVGVLKEEPPEPKEKA
jgi:chromosome segregation ATPase